MYVSRTVRKSCLSVRIFQLTPPNQRGRRPPDYTNETLAGKRPLVYARETNKTHSNSTLIRSQPRIKGLNPRAFVSIYGRNDGQLFLLAGGPGHACTTLLGRHRALRSRSLIIGTSMMRLSLLSSTLAAGARGRRWARHMGVAYSTGDSLDISNRLLWPFWLKELHTRMAFHPLLLLGQHKTLTTDPDSRRGIRWAVRTFYTTTLGIGRKHW